ncbi:hypothetical protein E4T56_gene8990, partial [Termitomyces sp. T112]
MTGSEGDGEHAVDVVVQVTLDRQTEDYLMRCENAARQCPEVRECFLMTGDVEYWLRIRTESVAAYEAIHCEVLSRLPGAVKGRAEKLVSAASTKGPNAGSRQQGHRR